MNTNSLDQYKLELSVKAKNGVNFIAAAAVVWTLITIVWTLSFKICDKCVLTFIVGGVMLPLAFVFSKVFKTQWTVENNPLQSLGLWLNFAQLFYFPILIFVLLKESRVFCICLCGDSGRSFFSIRMVLQRENLRHYGWGDFGGCHALGLLHQRRKSVVLHSRFYGCVANCYCFCRLCSVSKEPQALSIIT